MFAVMWLLGQVLLRGAAAHSRPWCAIGIFVVGAVVRALALAALLPTLGDGEARPLFRLITSLLILVPLLAFMAGLMNLIRTSAAHHSELEATADELLSTEQDALARTAELQQGAVAQVRGLLVGRLGAMQAGEASAMGKDLRHDVEQVIRPLSHRLATEEGVQSAPAPMGRASVAWGEIWRSATLGFPFRPVLLASILAIASVNALTTCTGNPLRGRGYTAAAWVIA